MIEAKKVQEYLNDVRSLSIESFNKKHPAEFFLTDCGTNPEHESPLTATTEKKLEKPRQKWAVSEQDLVYPLDLSKGWIWVGCSEPCELLILDSHISRVHAQFTRKERGLYLMDAESRNGTYVEGQPIKEVTRIDDRAILAFGPHQFTLYSKDSFYSAVKNYLKFK